MESDSLLQLLKRSWLLLLIGAIVGGVAGYVIAKTMKPSYEATVSLLVGPINADFDAQRASGNLARTYADLATSGPILRRTIGEAHQSLTVDGFRNDVNATSNDVTRIVTISVTNDSRRTAALLANNLADELIKVGSQGQLALTNFLESRAVSRLTPSQQSEIRDAATQAFGSLSAGKLTVVDPAEPPAKPSGPRTLLITVLGVIVGIIVASVLAFFRELRSRELDPAEIQIEGKPLPLLASLRSSGRFAVGSHETAVEYQLLATKIRLALEAGDIRTLHVVGLESGDGASNVAINLAKALAEKDSRVTLVDANTARNELTKALRLDSHSGYAELLQECSWRGNGNLASIKLADYGVADDATLTVIPRGTAAGHDLVDVETGKRLLRLLAAGGDLTVIETAPADQTSSTLIWATVADATLLVVNPRKMKQETVDLALRTFSLAGANIVGTVFTG
jgi:tyrosine-protein kinase